jgi:RimJ/RimL family protein N-acetyltransferase
MIVLREYSPSDLEELVALANNRNVSRYLVYTFPYPYTRPDAEQWIESGSREGGATTMAIEHEGRFAGSIGIKPQTGWKAHTAEVGYWIGEEFWGRGIASAALKEMTQLAFTHYSYRKLFAPVLGPNKASIRVLEKNSYVLEGIMEKEVYADDGYLDVHRYAKLRP